MFLRNDNTAKILHDATTQNTTTCPHTAVKTSNLVIPLAGVGTCELSDRNFVFVSGRNVTEEAGRALHGEIQSFPPANRTILK